jgi:hypothetical protein
MLYVIDFIKSDRKLLLRTPKGWAEGSGRKQTFPLLKSARLGLRVNPPSSQGAGRARHLEMLGFGVWLGKKPPDCFCAEYYGLNRGWGWLG